MGFSESRVAVGGGAGVSSGGWRVPSIVWIWAFLLARGWGVQQPYDEDCSMHGQMGFFAAGQSWSTPERARVDWQARSS
jgi:hypothetical protein|eukprot:COSAG01_NODE_559_length_15469_cov_11.071308_6_plen_79_part_00